MSAVSSGRRDGSWSRRQDQRSLSVGVSGASAGLQTMPTVRALCAVMPRSEGPYDLRLADQRVVMPARRRLRRVRQTCGLRGAEPRRVTSGDGRERLARIGPSSPANDDALEVSRHRAVGHTIGHEGPVRVRLTRKRLASSTGPSRSAVKVNVSRALSCAGPSPMRPISTTLGPNPMPSGRAT